MKREEGKELMRMRGVEVETIFGEMKHNHGIRRFILRGKEKVEIETGLFAMAHNIKKKNKKFLKI